MCNIVYVMIIFNISCRDSNGQVDPDLDPIHDQDPDLDPNPDPQV